MAGYFPATVAAALRGKRPRIAYLVEILIGPPVRYWNGFRPLTTLDGRRWTALKQLGDISGLDEVFDGEAQTLQVSISAAAMPSAILRAAATANKETYMWKLLRIWLQFFDEEWQPMDYPFAFRAGLITGLVIDREMKGGGAASRRVTVEAVNLFYGRSAAAHGYYTDSDQQARYPGDKGLQPIPSLQDATISIPW